MDINNLIWLFLVVFMIHNFEEIIMIEKWFNKTYSLIEHKIPARAKKKMDKFREINTAQFSFAVLLLFVIAAMLIVISVETDNYIYFLGINIFFALNILTHPVQSILLFKYTPGVITTILLILPYNIYVFNRLFAEQLISYDDIITSLIIVIALILILFLSHGLAKKLVK